MSRGPAWNRNTPENFWRKVTIRASDECWHWTGHLDSGGYGVVGWHSKLKKAHRVAYELTHGVTLPSEPPSKTFGVVMHTCDTPTCCNPTHLQLGTYLSNRHDCIAKGRNNAARGDANGSRLHPERLKRGDENPSRAQPEKLKRGSEHPNAGLAEVDVLDIRRRVAAGETSTSIGQRYGITTALIWKIKVRRIWRHI